jgi:hypothetical protein
LSASSNPPLDFFEPYIWPKWLVPQFRHSVESEEQPLENREGQQQVLRATGNALAGELSKSLPN